MASSWSWVTITQVTPTFSMMLTSSNWVCSRSFLSSAPSGSSSSSSLGFLARLRASATRTLFDGFAAVYTEGRDDDGAEEAESRLPALAEGDRTDAVDTDETIHKLLGALRPREQEVLALRFGLGGKPRLSLSQVGKALAVSKERVRQIQDRALEKLRSVASELGLEDALVTA